MRLARVLAVFAATLLATTVGVAQPAAADPLAAARIAYERGMDELRSQTQAKLTAGPDETYDERLAHLEQFETAGAWPADTAMSPLRDKHEQLLQHLVKAYRARANSLMAKDRALSRSIKNELDRWMTVNDLNGWTDHVAAPPRENPDERAVDATVGTPATRIALVPDLPDAYRFELRGTLPDKGRAILLLPVGQRLVSVPLDIDKGRFHALVTVTVDENGTAVLDPNLGVARTSKAFESDARDDATPMLDAAGAEIELVRWKPVLVMEKEALPKEKEAAVADGARESPAGSIRQLEIWRKDALEAVQTWKNKIQINNGKIEEKKRQIAMVKRRHRFPDTSALLSDLRRLQHENAGLEGHIADKRRKIATYDAQLNGLRKRLAELGG